LTTHCVTKWLNQKLYNVAETIGAGELVDLYLIIIFHLCLKIMTQLFSEVFPIFAVFVKDPQVVVSA
jgi:hypothetical protein